MADAPAARAVPCPTCGATDTDPCLSASGRDHPARRRILTGRFDPTERRALLALGASDVPGVLSSRTQPSRYGFPWVATGPAVRLQARGLARITARRSDSDPSSRETVHLTDTGREALDKEIGRG